MDFERLDEGKASKQGVLASYKATFMQFNKINENNRLYPSEIGKNRVLSEKTLQAMRENKLLGEINHPKDRFDVDYEKVAINTTTLYYDEPSDSIKGTFDILDTPMGRILKTLVDYGTHISLSARAMGKTRNVKGVDEIIEETYMFKTFDAVTDPGFSIATIDPSKDRINESLKDIYNSFTEDEKSQVSPLLESIGMPVDFLYTNDVQQANVDNDSEDSTLSENKSDMQNLIDEYQAIIDILKSQVDDKDKELEDSKNEYNTIIDMLKMSNDNLNLKLQAIQEEYDMALSTLTNSLRNTSIKNSDLDKRLEESLKAIDLLQNQLKRNKDILTISENNNQHLEDTSTSLNEALNISQSSIETLNEQLIESNNKNNELSNINEQLKRDYDALLDKYNKLVEDTNFKVNESFISGGSDNFTLVNVVNESKVSKSIDTLTNSLLNKLKK